MPDVQTPPEGTEQEQVTPQTPETETPQTPEVTEPETPATPQPETPQPEVVPKDKFVASQRESILNAARVDVANERIEQLTKQDTPTEEAMKLLYPDWDEFTDITKKALINQEAQGMRQRRIELKQADIDARQKLEDELDSLIEKPEYASKLKGRESEFKRFARSPKNRGISADTLAKAFLFDAEDETPPPNPPPIQEALPQGSGGPRDPLKPKKISVEEAAQIRKTDYKRYLELVKAGQIEELE